MSKKEIAIVTADDIRGRIFLVRGHKVMLDADLAAIYGYETKYFNRQVSNNHEKFEGDAFMFQLTREELDDLVRCKNFTSRDNRFFQGQSGGTRYLPRVFTEVGVYMLMTVLKGDVAVRQSRALVLAFKEMKDYLMDETGLIPAQDIARLSVQTAENTSAIRRIEHKLAEEMATKNDLAKFMTGFIDEHIGREFLFMDGQMVEADAAYTKIFGLAKKSIYLVDNFVGIKTLALLKNAAKGVKIIVFTDNHRKTLHLTEYQDFCKEYPQMKISFQRTMDKFHDRYIILDYKLRSEKMYNCGSSPKDSGRAVTSITKSTLKMAYHPMVDTLLNHPPYVLK